MINPEDAWVAGREHGRAEARCEAARELETLVNELFVDGDYELDELLDLVEKWEEK